MASDATNERGARRVTRAGDATIVLACAANQSYALPLAVMLRSALDHLAPGYRLDVYAVDDGLEANDRLRVQASLDERVTMRWLQPGRYPVRRCPRGDACPIRPTRS